MRLKGKVKSYIREKLNDGKVIHFSLFDPDKVDENQVYYLGKKLVEAGTDAFLIGGTLGVSQEKLDKIISSLTEFGFTYIIFPSNVNLISSKADAILFMSLLNSDDLYYVVGAQLVAAPIIKKLGLEVLPTAYVIIGHGGTAAHVGKARVIPYENTELILAYSLMARYMGMEFIYLEAGSGAPKTINPLAIKTVKSNVDDAIIIVGGGIRDEESGKLLASAGADIIVTGNIIEQDSEKALKIIKEIKSMRRK
jgi:geranylgeranylglyceryl diphosphate synthase (EC 2.5.1.41)